MEENEVLQNVNSQIEKLAKLHLTNKKKYTDLSKSILRYTSFLHPENIANNNFNNENFIEKVKTI
ncbi:hypothetical protein [Acinetobacter guillouiae]|uniref:hypothetical protein n=1 Tax=Acinetobacter guillouiae TaxID=106649 RepID=UPI00125F1FB7|nr:hypothetical protein [Acinetobacter guillouiae]